MSDLEVLIQQLSHDDAKIRMSAATAIGKIGNKKAISHLRNILEDESVAVIRAATQAIGKIGGCEQLEILESLLQHDELWIRKAAVQAIGYSGCEDAVPILVNLLGEMSLETLVREALVLLKVDPDFF